MCICGRPKCPTIPWLWEDSHGDNKQIIGDQAKSRKRLDMTRQGNDKKARLDKTKQNKTRQDKTRQDKTRS